MIKPGLSEHLIENEIGCGPFQAIVATFVYMSLKMAAIFTLVFMSYGNYNPGWRCLDNTTALDPDPSTSLNLSSTLGLDSVPSLNLSSVYKVNTSSTGDYMTDLSCSAFEACRQPEFNPESLTIVTQWGLVCDKAWVSSLIITIQMLGTLIGFLPSGQISDNFGRRKTAFVSVFVNSLLMGCSVFSPSWEIFAVFRFLSGVTYGFFTSVCYVYPSEFMTRRWRGPLSGIPAWSLGGMLFVGTCVVFKNWRHILVATSVMGILSVIPGFWIPESLRWLETKNRKEEFERVAKKMARTNKKTLTSFDDMEMPVEEKPDEDLTVLGENTGQKVNQPKYTLLDLFRPGYRLFSILCPVIYSFTMLNFLAISFGIKSLSGDFYLNMFLLYLLMLLCAPIPFFAPNLVGRQRSVFLLQCIVSIFFVTATVVEKFTDGNVRVITTLVLVLGAQICVDTSLCTLQVLVSELYPTVVRGLAMSWVLIVSSFSRLIAPFMIANDRESVYIWYMSMAILGILCCCMLSRVPETKGRPSKEMFEATVVRA